MSIPKPNNFNDFSRLEKEALKEISLETIKSDLLKSLKDSHQKDMADVANRIAVIEMRCTKLIQDGLETHTKAQLDKHFQKVIVSYQVDISKVLSPLLKKAEEDVSRLNSAVAKTATFCQKIEAQYSLRWSKPFFALTLSAGFAGALMGLLFFLLQVPAVSVFLMNEHTRKAYDIGSRVLAFEKEAKAKAEAKGRDKAIESPKTVKQRKKL